MSLFGSREEDPLLQDDLFAPSSAEEDASEPEESEASDQSSAKPNRTDERENDTRRIVCSREEAADGHLDHLNRALQRNWELTCVQLQEEGNFTFTLQRTSPPTSDSESIV